MDDRSFPVLQLTLEGMGYTIGVALSAHAAVLDAQLRKAVDEFCTPENLGRILDAEVSKQVKRSLAIEIETYFSYGNGRKAVHKAVLDRLNRDFAEDGQGID